jgi:hypothetical protein
MESVIASLGLDGFETAFSQGRAMTFDDAIAYALEEVSASGK